MANKEDVARALAGDKNLSKAKLTNTDLRGLDLRGADLRGASLYDSDLSGVDLRGANLSDADITDANFSGADLSGSSLRSVRGDGANFTEAELVTSDFESSYLDNSIFSSANLRGASFRQAKLNRANLLKANLTGAYFTNAQIKSADLRGANLNEAYLYETKLLRSDLSNASFLLARMDFSDLADAALRGADLRGANLSSVNLTYADLSGSNLEGAVLSDANLRSAILRGARLIRANLGGTLLSGASLYLATLTEANLTGADLVGANFTEADLTRADLSDADLTGADLTDADLTGANFTRANLTDAIDYARDPSEFDRRRTSGRATGTALKLAAPDAPADPREFKKRYPKEFDLLSRRGLAGRPFRPETIAAIQKQLASPVEWVVTTKKYAYTAQRYCPSPNDVLLLNINLSDSSLTERQRAALRKLAEVSRRSGHPHEKGRLFTIGWVRYCVGPSAWLIEEVQSDVQVARTGLKDPETRTKLADAGIDAESFEESIAALAPYTEAFYHDAIGLVFEMARAAGVEVEMLEYDAKREYGSPRNIYTDLPREMGMVLRGDSRVMPGTFNHVWAYRPNPPRKKRRPR